MRSPSIVPGFDVDVYLDLDDFGNLGRAYRNVGEAADKARVIRRFIERQYNNRIQIVAFNTSEDWSRDVSEDIAREIKDLCERKSEEVSTALKECIEYQIDLGARSKQYVR